MNKYLVLAPVTLRDLQLRLTTEQYADRRYVVRPVKGQEGVYEPIVEVSFKAGEKIEISTDIPKGLHGKLKPIAIPSQAAPVSGPPSSQPSDGSDAHTEAAESDDPEEPEGDDPLADTDIEGQGRKARRRGR